jgi:hypothetical protein
MDVVRIIFVFPSEALRVAIVEEVFAVGAVVDVEAVEAVEAAVVVPGVPLESSRPLLMRIGIADDLTRFGFRGTASFGSARSVQDVVVI